MRISNQTGFSLIELLLVVVIIGIIAALAIPGLQRALVAAENRNVFATLRTIHSTEVGLFSQNSRFARLDELNNAMGGKLGSVAGNQLFRGKYTFEMVPSTPTDSELKEEYTIIVTRSFSDPIAYQFEVTSAGQVHRIFPGPDDF